MARRFALVGLFVVWPYQRGAMMQLALACFTSTLYLVVQIVCMPYKNTADNFVALACSTSLTVTLFGCVLFKYDVLLEAEQIQKRMGPSQRAFFTLDTTALTYMILASTIGALAITMLLLLVQTVQAHRKRLHDKLHAKARRLRWVANGMEVEVHLPRDKLPAKAATQWEPTYAMGAVSNRFHIFLSQQAAASIDPLTVGSSPSLALVRCDSHMARRVWDRNAPPQRLGHRARSDAHCEAEVAPLDHVSKISSGTPLPGSPL